MRSAEKIPQIHKLPFPHVIVKDFLDEQTLDLVTYALAGLEYDFDESDLFNYLSFGLTEVDHPVINILRDDLGDETWRAKVAERFGVEVLSNAETISLNILLWEKFVTRCVRLYYLFHLNKQLEYEDYFTQA